MKMKDRPLIQQIIIHAIIRKVTSGVRELELA